MSRFHENQYTVTDGAPIALSHTALGMHKLLSATLETNLKLSSLKKNTQTHGADITEILDHRIFSSLIGELLANEIAAIHTDLIRNPDIDGYPDLLQIATAESRTFLGKATREDFLTYPFGGIEVKNTLGYKKTDVFIGPAETRVSRIQAALNWKAHHNKTNNLVAIWSDYINGSPTIVALFYCNTLTTSDWDMRRPKAGSAMTSFAQLNRTGTKKVYAGLKLFYKSSEHEEFLKRLAT